MHPTRRKDGPPVPDALPPQAPTSIAPSLVVPDGPAAIDFYVRAFDARELYRVPDGGVAQLAIGDATFWIAGPSAQLQRHLPADLPGRSVWMILTVPDPDAVRARAVAAGAHPEHEISDSHGWRLGSLVDPYGHRWEIGRPLGSWPPSGRG
jgi:PhnB protein